MGQMAQMVRSGMTVLGLLALVSALMVTTTSTTRTVMSIRKQRGRGRLSQTYSAQQEQPALQVRQALQDRLGLMELMDQSGTPELVLRELDSESMETSI
jgi:hypothetical protein